MGWDAFATAPDGGELKRFWKHSDGRNGLADPTLDAAFAAASETIKSNGVDWLLKAGGLDCSACAEALQAATGMDCWGPDLGPAEVQRFNDGAAWKGVKGEAWAIESAKAFLWTCAANGLGISFSR